ncbi:MAG: hypothetical protein KGJ06_00555 [Pseudomonadota bacterium]|nr:hypothetical protein [Pseudomonadota bacterium]
MTPLLKAIFNYDFSRVSGANPFGACFFGRPLLLEDLHKVFAAVSAGSIEIGGRTIPSAVRIPGKKSGAPFMIIAQLHGNEPAGLAGILLAMALSQAGKLERDVIGIIGNPLAARQYFEAWAASPQARQETRDAYRCGLGEDGRLLPDMNRIPVDFLTRAPADHHTRRAQELYTVAEHSCGILDIHSARGNMICITDHRRDADLQDSPIRGVLTGLADAISAHASAAVSVQTFKTIAQSLANIESQTGIEAGRHESPDAPQIAASFTLSLLHTLKLTAENPVHKKESGVFERYAVQPRLTYADLPHDAYSIKPQDRIYMATACHSLETVPEHTSRLIVRAGDGSYRLQPVLEYIVMPAGELAYAVHQYEEMEAIAEGQVVAVAVPSGTVFKAPFAFSGIFFSKSATLYDKDPAVGPWPVAKADLDRIKFCYPCEVSPLRIDFTR